MSTPATRFAALVDGFAGDPDITLPDDGPSASGRKFGSNGLKFRNKIFAMLSRDQLVVKLPKARVDELVAAQAGERMVSSGARVMKEWLVVAANAQLDWGALAREARDFAASQS